MSRAEGKNLRIFPGRMQEALDNVDAESYGFRHSEAAGRGIPNPRLGREPSEADRGRKGGARKRSPADFATTQGQCTTNSTQARQK